MTSAWVDTGDISGPSADSTILEQIGSSNTFKLKPKPDANLREAVMDLSLVLPERVHLKIVGQEVNASFHRKVMFASIFNFFYTSMLKTKYNLYQFLGNLFLVGNTGTITIDKHRGENISLTCNEGILSLLILSLSWSKTHFKEMFLF